MILLPPVVNFYAGPGSGKSTMSAGLFYRLKSAGICAELSGEYAKDLTWARRHHELRDQIYVFASVIWSSATHRFFSPSYTRLPTTRRPLEI